MSESQSGWKDLFSAENRGSAITLSAGVALYATNSYIVITILPSVVQDIGGLAWYAWNTTLYVVCSILGSALSARLMRTAGRNVPSCSVSCDHIPRRSWALFRARDVMRGVIESFKAEQAA